MYKLQPTTRFKKDLKKIKGNPILYNPTVSVLKILEAKGVEGIPLKMKPHKLLGKYKGNWECHIKPDLLVIWIQIEDPKTIRLVRLGTHSDLFK